MPGEIPVGPFLLHRVIAGGGMGVVWLGTHRVHGVDVAVKVLKNQRLVSGSGPMFVREVQSVASLAHPRIVGVFDYGQITDDAARASGDKLVAGSPYLAMELAHGTLHEVLEDPLPWVEVRAILLQVLDGLAHAHARGVIHRDIKPSNLLLFDDDGDRSLKLADFGLAWRAWIPEEHGGLSGTPSYMAPEQVLQQQGSFGPWTDLYALGCVTWKMLTGQNLFAFDDKRRVLFAQIGRDPGDFAPRQGVPDGLEQWLRRLLRKSPMARYRCAADAAMALQRLGDGPSPGLSGVPADNSRRQTTFTATELFTVLPVSGELQVAAPPLAFEDRPPPPSSWRASVPVRPARRLSGAGLGIYGLRRLTMVGREPEREALWEALRSVSRSERPSAVVIRGMAGTGKTCLATWLAERAHELGVASSLWATHGLPAGPGDGVVAALERYLHTVGLSRDELSKQFGERVPWLPDEVISRVATVFRPREGEGAPDPVERLEALLVLLRQLALDRPVILHIDDGQWGADALRLARRILEASMTVLVVVTVRDEALEVATPSWNEVEQLLDMGEVTELAIEPLVGRARSMLIREVLGLQDELARAVEDRTDGVPLFAVQLVGDWVERGLLEAGSSGFQLREGVVADLPDKIHDLWTRRVEHLLAHLGPDDEVALELAAELGQDVSRVEWSEACGLAGGVEPSVDLVDALMRSGLAVARGARDWRFVHGMLAESVARRAREAGRSTAHRSICSVALRGLGGASRRKGELLVSERLLERSAALADHDEVLLASARCQQATTQFRLGRVERAEAGFVEFLPILEGGQDTDLYAAALNNYGLLLLSLGRLLEAREAWSRCLAMRRVTGNRMGEAVALGNQAMVEVYLGEARTALGLLREAESLSRADANHHHTSVTLVNIGGLLLQNGDVEDARRTFVDARDLARASDSQVGEVLALEGLGRTWHQAGRMSEAREVLEEAMESSSAAQNPFIKAAVLYSLGVVFRDCDQLEEAVMHLREAQDTQRRIADPHVVVRTLCCLGELEARTGQADVSAERFAEAEALMSGDANETEWVALWCRRGLAHLYLGRTDQARSCLERATALLKPDRWGEAEAIRGVEELQRALRAT